MVNFIGIGAQKSGTSWVYACLYEHPDICAPIKEIHFFSRPRFEKGQSWYEAHFAKCAPTKCTGEFSTSYLYSGEAAERIARMYPHVKIIAIMRNPIDRAYSQYRNAIKAGEIEASVPFDEFQRNEPSVLNQGQYAEQLARYYAVFPPSQILVLIYEDIAKDPKMFMKQIYGFLGVDTSFVPSMLYSQVNVARTPKIVHVDRVMHLCAEFLRSHGLDRVVWLIRKTGITDFLRACNTNKHGKESRSETIDRTALRAHFRQDTVQLEKIVGRDMVKEWDLI